MTESTYSYAELSEMANSEKISIDILEQAGLLSERLINYFLTLKRVRDVDNVKELEEWDRQGKKHVNKKIRLAVREGRTREIATALGITGQSRDEASGYEKLVKELKPASKHVVIKGPRGSGKTAKMLLLVKKLFEEFDREMHVIGDVALRGMSQEDLERANEVFLDDLPKEWFESEYPTVEPYLHYDHNLSGILQKIRDLNGEKVILLDELSTQGLQSGRDMKNVFGKVLNGLRKGKGGSTRPFSIGHEGSTDIQKFMRDDAGIVIEAEGTKREGKIDKLTVYTKDQRKGAYQKYMERDYDYQIKGWDDVPKNSPFQYDTNFFATLDIDLDNPEEQIRQGKLVKGWEEYQESEDDEDDEVNIDYKQIKCNKDKCGQTAERYKDDDYNPVLEEGYCHNHTPRDSEESNSKEDNKVGKNWDDTECRNDNCTNHFHYEAENPYCSEHRK